MLVLTADKADVEGLAAAPAAKRLRLRRRSRAGGESSGAHRYVTCAWPRSSYSTIRSHMLTRARIWTFVEFVNEYTGPRRQPGIRDSQSHHQAPASSAPFHRFGFIIRQDGQVSPLVSEQIPRLCSPGLCILSIMQTTRRGFVASLRRQLSWARVISAGPKTRFWVKAHTGTRRSTIGGTAREYQVRQYAWRCGGFARPDLCPSHGERASESHDTMVVFDDKGKFVKSWGKDFKGGAHGLHIAKEGQK